MIKMNRLPRILCLLMAATFLHCGDGSDAVPKPHAYPRIEFPERNTIPFDLTDCPFTFDFPDYFEVRKETSFFDEPLDKVCWFDLVSDEFNAQIHCSYYQVGVEKSFDKLVSDAFNIANRINQRSNYMDELRLANAQGVSGLALEFTGPAASPMHFYLTDSTTHFFKASLYYDARVVPDSLRPVTDFIKYDIAGIINSFRWE